MCIRDSQKVALQNALDLAEHASQAKSTFLTNMSHDFRTPMNSISGFASIALDHLNDTDRVRDCLRKIMLSSDHLLSLVNDILDVSRIESGKMSFNEDIVSLPDAVIEVQDTVSYTHLVLLVEADLRLGHAGHGGELLHPVHGLPPQRCWWMNFYDSSFPRERAAQEKPRAWKTPAD